MWRPSRLESWTWELGAGTPKPPGALDSQQLPSALQLDCHPLHRCRCCPLLPAPAALRSISLHCCYFPAFQACTSPSSPLKRPGTLNNPSTMQ